MILICQNHPK